MDISESFLFIFFSVYVILFEEEFFHRKIRSVFEQGYFYLTSKVGGIRRVLFYIFTLFNRNKGL